MAYVDRVADRVASVQVAALLLSVLAVPFYVIGFVAAVVWLVVRWCVAAALVGFADVKRSGGADAR